MIHFTPKPEDRWILEVTIEPKDIHSPAGRDFVWSKRAQDWRVIYSRTLSGGKWIRCDGMNSPRPFSYYENAKFTSLSEEQMFLLCL
jgi:hypothetical protein